MTSHRVLALILLHPTEFQLGFDEADGDVGMTYDDDPTSSRSEAYDLGRSLGRALNYPELDS